MKVEPRIKGFLCTTSHPEGCAIDVKNQIDVAKQAGPIPDSPKKVLVIGSSGGYGLASRITAAFGCNAATVGVFYERPGSLKRSGTPGWYKSAAFSEQAREAGLYATDLNGDGFSPEVKQATIEVIKRDLGQVDMVVYSIASPARELPDGSFVRSSLKPIGETFEGGSINLTTGVMRGISIEPATQQEIDDTVKVMGGEDWESWIAALLEAGVLAKGCITTNYAYLGSDVTWPIYHHGTIGKAKDDMDRAAVALQEPMASIQGRAYVAVMKGIMTKGGSAIPTMSIYLSLLFKAMKAKGTHEECIHQTNRLFKKLFVDDDLKLDEVGRLRLDDLELSEDIQGFIRDTRPNLTTENLMELSDFAGCRRSFLQMHGFAFPGVDYDAEIDPIVSMPLEFGG